MNFVLDNNYFLYQGRLYQQMNGIAMGTACAPAVANIYAATFEEISMPLWKELGLVFYSRYIDDIFLIFQGPSQGLQELLSKVELPGLEITWDYSFSRLSFLDVDVRLSQGEIETSVFRKELNKYMYIPFSSGHPLSVKKALVKAERTRMKTICSSPELFHECQEVFRLNLYRRGYPSSLLLKWFSDDLKTRSEPKKSLFLPSEYNPAWEYINMSKLEQAWQDSTSSFREFLPEELVDPRFIKCLKRGQNMYDIFNRDNLTVLAAEASLGDLDSVDAVLREGLL